MIIETRLMKKVAALALSLICAVTAGMLLSPVKVDAATVEDQGDCSDNGDGSVTYVLDSEGLLTISGKGGIASHYFKDQWYDHSGDIKSVVIEEGITDIGIYSFWYCTNISSVSFPSTLKTIGGHAFAGTSITDLRLNEGLEEIGQSCFQDCASISSVSFPSSLTNIDKWAFRACTSLGSLTIPESVTDIGAECFRGCTSLRTVTFEGTGRKIVASSAFSNCYLTSVTFGDIGLDRFVFSGCTANTLYYTGSRSSYNSSFDDVFTNVVFTKCEVTFNYNDPPHYNTKTVLYDTGSKITDAPEPPEPYFGYEFTGEWYTSENFNPDTYFDIANTELTDDIELYAKWQKAYYCAGYAVSLEGDIGATFYIHLSDEILDDENAVITLSCDIPGKPTVTVEYKNTGLAFKSMEDYIKQNVACKAFKINVPPAAMTCGIDVTLSNGTVSVGVHDGFTVYAYSRSILASSDEEYARAKDLVRSMLNYGAYCQKYFHVNESDPADTGIDYDMADLPATGSVPIPVWSGVSVRDPGVIYVSSSLVLNSNTDAVVKFKLKEDEEQDLSWSDYEISVKDIHDNPIDAVITTNDSTGTASVRINGIIAGNHDKVHRIVFRNTVNNSYSVQYSYRLECYCAAVGIKETEDTPIRNLIRALYCYSTEALDYRKNN